MDMKKTKEIATRRTNLDAVIRILKQEGCLISPENQVINEQYVKGEITKDQVYEKLLNRIVRAKLEHPEYFQKEAI